ncbi:hypothetical protein JCM5350_007063 [Sporobolomyces pararoseus]
MDYVWGSRGTKGSQAGGWNQKGILIDFIGQISTPSKIHLISLDLLVGLFQLLTLLVSFSITLPSDLEASSSSSTVPVTITQQTQTQTGTTSIIITATTTNTNGTTSSSVNDSSSSEAARDYFGLLGLHESNDQEDESTHTSYREFELTSSSSSSETEEEEEGEVEVRRESSRGLGRGGGYEQTRQFDDQDDDDIDQGDFDGSILDHGREEEEQDEIDLYGPSSPSLSSTTTKQPSTSAAVHYYQRERIPLNPIAKLRFRHVWNEIKPGSFKESFERVEENGLRDIEEGRSHHGRGNRSRRRRGRRRNGG